MDSDGIHRLRGVLEDAAGISASSIRFVFNTNSQFLGRRQHLRASLSAPVVVTVDRTGQKFHGRSMNVSEGGMLVGDLDSGLPAPGSRVKFALAPRSMRDPIFGTAVVTRADNARGMLAVDFDQFARGAADELARVVFEAMQGARSRGR
jgi:c-di-GMP-binding flagellar brake protein YcgR